MKRARRLFVVLSLMGLVARATGCVERCVASPTNER
jgi:hypothetical protein